MYFCLREIRVYNDSDGPTEIAVVVETEIICRRLREEVNYLAGDYHADLLDFHALY